MNQLHPLIMPWQESGLRRRFGDAIARIKVRNFPAPVRIELLRNTFVIQITMEMLDRDTGII